MKTTLILIYLVFCSITSIAQSDGVLIDYYDTNTSTYEKALQLWTKDGSDYIGLSVLGTKVLNSGSIEYSWEGFSVGLTNHAFEDLKYTLLDDSIVGSFITYVMIVSDSSDNEVGFIYASSPSSSSTDSIGADTSYNDFVDYTDSLNTASGEDFSLPDGSTVWDINYVFPVNLDQSNSYSSTYSSSDISYTVYYDSSTDNNKFEIIKDIDRDKIVGFRYYSDSNNQEYTLFVHPNN